MSIAIIFGGTGTLAKNVLPLLLKDPRLERIRLLSRGEHTQMQMQDSLSSEDRTRVDFFVGDIRDADRLKKAAKGCSQVYHFAAMKSVDKAEYDPWEAVQSNIYGTKNVIEACIENQVQKAIFTSTDKAVSPLNIYGASKLVAEKLFIQANLGRHRTQFSVCRYGNVLGSQGSVLSRWQKALCDGLPIRVTDSEMTRFFILPKDAAAFVVDSLNRMHGGEVFIPKMKSTTLWKLADALCLLMTDKSVEQSGLQMTGIRPGEKLHEELISNEEVKLTTDCGDFYIRWPNEHLFPFARHGKTVKEGFSSFEAKRFSFKELKEMIEWELGLSQNSVAATTASGTTVKKPSIDASKLELML